MNSILFLIKTLKQSIFFFLTLATLIYFFPINTYADSSISSINVKDFGAYGDGIHDDTIAIQQALSSNYDTIIFDYGEYKITNCISLTMPNKTIIGNNAILFTDNNYRTRDNYYEWVFNINTHNIYIENLFFQARETILVGYKTQVGIQNAENVTLNSCYFYIPNTVYHNSINRDIEYSNLDLYTNWKNISIISCVFFNCADTEHGVCVEFRDLKNKGCENGNLLNSICISNCHDEIIACFSSKTESTKIQDITIKNNYIMAMNTINSSSRNVGISLGYNPNGIDNLYFQNNKIYAFSNHTLFTIGNNTNTHISNNDINFCILSNSYVYLAKAYSSNNEVHFYDNDINIINESNAKLFQEFYGNISNYSNIITSQ